MEIKGIVQGVAFRAWTERMAVWLKLTGWVCNRNNGSVEAVFCGAADAVDRMLAMCREGPPAARVSRVLEEPFIGEPPPSFQVLPTPQSR